ncbi:50S ribosomal protein L35, partial [bacterium]
NKTAAKRFKITGTGKITRRMSHNSHQFLHKKASRKRRLEGEPEVFQGEQKRMRRLLVIGQTKKKNRAVPVVVDREARAAADRAKLVSMVTVG